MTPPVRVPIRIPDAEVAPIVTLCWKESPALERCDRRAGHQGRHTWELQWVPMDNPEQ